MSHSTLVMMLFVIVLLAFSVTLYLFEQSSTRTFLSATFGPQFTQASIKLVLPPGKMNQTEVMPHG